MLSNATTVMSMSFLTLEFLDINGPI